MQFPQILVYESDGLLAAMLRETAKTKRWALREARKPELCLRLLRALCPTVLVLKIATHAKREAGLPVKEEEEQQRAADREKEQVHPWWRWATPRTRAWSLWLGILERVTSSCPRSRGKCCRISWSGCWKRRLPRTSLDWLGNNNGEW